MGVTICALKSETFNTVITRFFPSCLLRKTQIICRINITGHEDRKLKLILSELLVLIASNN